MEDRSCLHECHGKWAIGKWGLKGRAFSNSPQWLLEAPCDGGGRNAEHSFRAEPSHRGAGKAEPFLHILQLRLKGQRLCLSSSPGKDCNCF